MKDKILKFVLVLSLILNISMLASAGYTHYMQSRYQASPFEYGIKKPGWQVPSCLFEELSLKPAQLKTMRYRAFAYHADLDEKRRNIEQKRVSLVALIQADSPDGNAIDTTIAEINQLQLEVQKTAVTHMLEFKGMLDTDQQKKFLGLVEGAMTKREGLRCP
jgi:Spy/CpxP family protein refolding chaperone